MPTYTQTGLELPANGEQDGIWGDTVNDNMRIIDRLTNGVGAIALSGTTHTLTTAQGELSPGQFAVLVFGGSPSGTNTVTISPNDAQHVYIVRNTTAQSVILTQGSGGNVTVAAGKSAIVACDGAGSGAAVTDITAGFSFQASSAALTAIAALDVTDGNFIVSNGTTWVAESGDTVLTSIGVTASTAELNIMDGVTASTAELNVLDGIPATLTSTELGYVDGVTSAIQTQLDAKAPLSAPTFTGLVTAPNLTITGTTKAAGQFYTGTTAPTNTNRLNYDGAFHATSFVGNGSGLTGINSGLTLLATGTASASASVDFTAFNSTLYGNYLFVLSNVVLSTDANLNVRASINGGFSYMNNSGNYAWWAVSARTAGVDRNGADSATAVSLLYSDARTVSGNAGGAGRGINGNLYLFSPSAAAGGSGVFMKSQFAYLDTSTNFVTSDGMGAVLVDDDGDPVDGIRFIPSTGTITSGTFYMYGIVK